VSEERRAQGGTEGKEMSNKENAARKEEEEEE
jgi:hypothetical protein